MVEIVKTLQAPPPRRILVTFWPDWKGQQLRETSRGLCCRRPSSKRKTLALNRFYPPGVRRGMMAVWCCTTPKVTPPCGRALPAG